MAEGLARGRTLEELITVADEEVMDPEEVLDAEELFTDRTPEM